MSLEKAQQLVEEREKKRMAWGVDVYDKLSAQLLVELIEEIRLLRDDLKRERGVSTWHKSIS